MGACRSAPASLAGLSRAPAPRVIDPIRLCGIYVARRFDPRRPVTPRPAPLAGLINEAHPLGLVGPDLYSDLRYLVGPLTPHAPR